MMDTFKIKQGNTSPAIRRSFTDGAGAALPIPDGAGVVFTMAHNGVVIVDRQPCEIDGNDAIYRWQDGDTDISGVMQGEFTIVYADTATETIPNDGYIDITITRALAVVSGAGDA